MKHLTRMLLILCLAFACCAVSHAQDEKISLDDAFAAAAAYEWGESRVPLATIEAAVFEAAGDDRAARAMEARVLGLLTDRAATRDAKAFACRQLRIVGGEASIGPLARLLDDADLAHMAEYALVAIPIAAAEDALVRYHIKRLVERTAAGSDRARDALLTMREPFVDSHIAKAALEGDATMAVIGAEMLGARGAADHVETLEALAADDQPAAVRIAANLALVQVHDWSVDVSTAPYFRRALAAAESVEDRKRVLAAIEARNDGSLLRIVQRQLDDPDTGADAAAVVIALALASESDDRNASKEAVRDVMARFPDNAALQEQAAAAIAQLERNEGFITEWVLSGPYHKDRADDGDMFSYAYPPERDAARAEWMTPEEGVQPPGIVDLSRVFGGQDRCAYARVRIRADRDQRVQLQIGSDDGVKAWLNGELVHENNAARALALNQDVVVVRLTRGWNELMLKITQGGGDWGFAARIRDVDGLAVEGLTFAKPE